MLDNLIQLLEEIITKLEVKKLDLVNNSSFNIYEEELKLLEEDYNNIVNVELSKIKEILNDLPFTADEQTVLYKFIETIQILLLLNKNKNTTFNISAQQLNHLNIFLNKVKEVKQKQEEQTSKEKELIDEKINLCKELYNKITNDNNTAFINELDLLENLFNEFDVNVTLRKEILIDILRYNKALFEKELLKDKVEPKIERLNINEVKELFRKYNYDFDSLKEKQQEFILTYASISNMNEVFETLNVLHFPKFNLPKDSSKLTAILINCDKETIEMVVEFSKSRGITPNDLTAIIPVLVNQKSRNVKKVNNPKNPKEETPLITGKSKDYMDNVEFLEEQGFDVQYIYNKCRELLVVNNERLKENFASFKMYGFKFEQDSYGNLTHPALSCLISNNFIEVVDQFLEICPYGFQYVKDNMSRILVYSDPQGLLFYNIYASYMNENEYGDRMESEGPFNKYYKLRGEITRYIGSGYENIPYRGVTEENKQEKTMTITPPIQNRQIFEDAVLEVKNDCKVVKELTENDEVLQQLEEYTDEQNKLRYNFNGTLISKLKVKRIYNILKNYNLHEYEDSLLYAVLYNTIINQHDYEKVKQIVKSRCK